MNELTLHTPSQKFLSMIICKMPYVDGMDAQTFIRSWSALWLWMHHLTGHLQGARLNQAYTFRKGQLVLHFSKDDKQFQLSWEKRGNQALLTFNEKPSLPKRRVSVFRELPVDSTVVSVTTKSDDRLLRMELSGGHFFVFGFFPALMNVYLFKKDAIIQSFLKQPSTDLIDGEWISHKDELPHVIPGGQLSPNKLLEGKAGLSLDPENNIIHFGKSDSTVTYTIDRLVIEVLRSGQKPKQTTGQSLQKIAKTVLKRWKSKQVKIESELEEAESWPEQELKLQAMQMGLGMRINLASTGGMLNIAADLSPTGYALSYQLDSSIPLPQQIEATAKKIRKYRNKLELLKEVLNSASTDINALEAILIEPDNDRLHNFLKSHGETLDQSGKQSAERKPYKKFTSPGGFDILVGRSSSDNDTLTFKVAGKQDWWFHARQVRGSHVILRTGNQEPQRSDIVAAAEHAARNSKAKHSGMVVVQYCQRKHLTKPKGSHPGAVLVHQEQSITIQLD